MVRCNDACGRSATLTASPGRWVLFGWRPKASAFYVHKTHITWRLAEAGRGCMHEKICFIFISGLTQCEACLLSKWVMSKENCGSLSCCPSNPGKQNEKKKLQSSVNPESSLALRQIAPKKKMKSICLLTCS